MDLWTKNKNTWIDNQVENERVSGDDGDVIPRIHGEESERRRRRNSYAPQSRFGIECMSKASNDSGKPLAH